MNFLRDLFQSIREALCPTPEPVNFAAMNRNWPDVSRSRWVAS